jgi:hypothetical protein
MNKVPAKGTCDSMTKSVERVRRVGVSGGRKASPKGWTPDRRAQQAVLIRGWQPWRRSTGPKTEAGKARCAMNALKHGCTGRAYRHDCGASATRSVLPSTTIGFLRLYIRLRDLPRRGDYVLKADALAMRLSAAIDGLRHFREKAGREDFSKIE